MPAVPTCLVLVPLRSFDDPKTRLADVLSHTERADLTRRLATGVVEALRSRAWTTAVVTDDSVVTQWATDLGLDVVRPARPGLNPAIDAGRDEARRLDAALVAVAPADLAAPAALPAALELATAPGHERHVSAAPDRHGDGTNLLVVPTAVEFAFAYGPGSFDRHRAEADRLELRFTSIEDALLGWDVDTPAELDWYLKSSDVADDRRS